MARAKNRGYQQSFSPSYTIRRWRLGIYIRLSKEDLKKGKDDSNSVKNQRDLLNDFYRRNIDEFESITEYVDDGHTGTDANREDFQRLLADVMSGKINCVIVKDLSRFARNYSDAGSLIDNLFVQMGVRFISLAENVDSYKNPDSVSNIIVPITNVMNDNYCYQTSKKIRQVFDYKRRNGQYIGAFAPYGYVKHPKDKHRLIVDPDAAENVKLIFTMLIQGSSKRAIALYLNEHGVPSPSAYKVQKGLPVSTRGYDDPMWGVRMIHSILTNPTYTGDLAQGRSRVKSYKVHQIEAVPREEWVEVAGTHEAIIDYETFDKVQALLQRDTRTSPKGREVHLFSGFLKCADCGRAITRCVGKNNNVYYSCSTYKNRSRTACTMHSIKHERLEAAVLFAVQHQVHLAVSYSEIVTQINSAPIKKSQSYRLDDLITAKERELTKITRYKQSLYQDWKDGEITQQEYRDMKADYERQTSDISAVLTRLNAERAELANGVDNEHPALVAFMKYQNIEALNREILVELVYLYFKEKIYCYIDIGFFNKGALKAMLKYSVPLVPNALSWWVLSASDRSIVLVFLGAAFNGLLSVGHKFSNLFMVFYNIFNISWTESASLHLNEPDCEGFISGVIVNMFKLFSSIAIGMIACMPFVFPIMINEKFNDAYGIINRLMESR